MLVPHQVTQHASDKYITRPYYLRPEQKPDFISYMMYNYLTFSFKQQPTLCIAPLFVSPSHTAPTTTFITDDTFSSFLCNFLLNCIFYRSQAQMGKPFILEYNKPHLT